MKTKIFTIFLLLFLNMEKSFAFGLVCKINDENYYYFYVENDNQYTTYSVKSDGRDYKISGYTYPDGVYYTPKELNLGNSIISRKTLSFKISGQEGKCDLKKTKKEVKKAIEKEIKKLRTNNRI